MALEELILLYYLKISSFLIIIIFIFFIKFIFFDKVLLNKEILKINKNENISNIVNTSFETSYINKNLYIYVMKFYNDFYKHIHFGEFQFTENVTIYEILKIISEPSNSLKKITIVEGWQEYQLNPLLKNIFRKFRNLNYYEIIADTYLINSYDNFESFVENVSKQKNILFSRYKDHHLLKKFNIEEIIIIASLIEKEGIDYLDKKKIASVIFNRIDKKMRLQIDATVIFSITKGKYKFERLLNRKDLKVIDQYNTYIVDYLPPKPICYVGTKTIELIFENYKSDFLYYFFDENQKIHIFSKTYKEHVNKLNAYRKSK